MLCCNVVVLQCCCVAMLQNLSTGVCLYSMEGLNKQV